MAGYDNDIRNDLGDILTNKRGTEWVRVGAVTNKDSGAESIDVRVWYMNDDGQDTPTAKGFRMKRADVVDALGKIEESLETGSFEVAERLEDGTDREELATYKAGRDELVVARVVVKEKDGGLTDEKCIDIRRWYYDENDELKPTKKGIRLKGEVLSGVLSLIDNYLQDGAEEHAETDECNQ